MMNDWSRLNTIQSCFKNSIHAFAESKGTFPESDDIEERTELAAMVDTTLISVVSCVFSRCWSEGCVVNYHNLFDGFSSTRLRYVRWARMLSVLAPSPPRNAAARSLQFLQVIPVGSVRLWWRGAVVVVRGGGGLARGQSLVAGG